MNSVFFIMTKSLDIKKYHLEVMIILGYRHFT